MYTLQGIHQTVWYGTHIRHSFTQTSSSEALITGIFECRLQAYMYWCRVPTSTSMHSEVSWLSLQAEKHVYWCRVEAHVRIGDQSLYYTYIVSMHSEVLWYGLVLYSTSACYPVLCSIVLVKHTCEQPSALTGFEYERDYYPYKTKGPFKLKSCT